MGRDHLEASRPLGLPAWNSTALGCRESSRLFEVRPSVALARPGYA